MKLTCDSPLKLDSDNVRKRDVKADSKLEPVERKQMYKTKEQKEKLKKFYD